MDASPFEEEDPELKDFQQVFVNPEIVEEEGEEWSFNEGCLSIPHIREDVSRKSKIRIRYQDEHFDTYEEEFECIAFTLFNMSMIILKEFYLQII